MLFSDTFQTISKPCEGVFKDKGSKFLAYAYPFQSESSLKEILQKLKLEHPKANHYCYAYRLGLDKNIFRVNDDGEPAGTAGRPILNTLLSLDVTNVLVVVVRYFGGTLLGVPGLIYAYKAATEAVINQTEIIQKTVQDVYQINFDYIQMNEVMKLIKDEKLESFEPIFDLSCEIKLAINQSDVNKIIGKLESLNHLKIKYLHSI